MRTTWWSLPAMLLVWSPAAVADGFQPAASIRAAALAALPAGAAAEARRIRTRRPHRCGPASMRRSPAVRAGAPQSR